MYWKIGHNSFSLNPSRAHTMSLKSLKRMAISCQDPERDLQQVVLGGFELRLQQAAWMNWSVRVIQTVATRSHSPTITCHSTSLYRKEDDLRACSNQLAFIFFGKAIQKACNKYKQYEKYIDLTNLQIRQTIILISKVD